MTEAAALEHSLRRMAAQETLFAPRPSRLSLLGLALDPAQGPARRINIWRNHAIETVLTLAQPYLDWADLALDTWLSGYDDSLSFAEHAPAELELLWLDASRLPADAAWLQGRITALRALSRAPILVLSTAPVAASGPDVQAADLAAVCGAAGVPLIDARLAKVAGSPLSAAAQSLVARELACRWLPALLLPPVKAVAVDLDHTLYAGVLGEDGPEGVRLEPGHVELQRSLKALRERGVFLALVSRNELVDVRALFEARTDFPLRWSDFSVTEVSWGDKAEALQRVAQALNIDVSAVAFVDDNPGELAQVGLRLPTLRSVFAHADAALTTCVLEHLPALWRWRVSAEDAKRVADLAANTQRAELADADPEAYFRSLGVRLRFSLNDAAQLVRMAEMSGKTNQFNLALARLGEADYAARLADPAGAVVTVELADRFSDSGIIGLLAARIGGEEGTDGGEIVVDELLISCRAMGRRLEDSIVIGALQCLPARPVRFNVTEGPRNQPARHWLGEASRWPAERVQSFTPPDGVLIERALP